MRWLFDSTVTLKVFGVISVLLGVFWSLHHSKVDAIASFVVAATCFGVAWMGDHYGIKRTKL